MKRLQLDIPLMDNTITEPLPVPHIQNHPTGNAFIENNIPLVSPQYDADVKTGRALALGATNDLAIPIHYTLGAEEFTNGDNELAGMTFSHGSAGATNSQSSAEAHSGTYSSVITSTQDVSSFNRTDNVFDTSLTYYIEFWVYLPSGQGVTEVELSNAGFSISNISDTGVFSTTVTDTWVKLWTVVNPIYTNIGVAGKGIVIAGEFFYVDDAIAGEITNPNSFLTYFDVELNEIVQLDMSTGLPV